ncbi:Methionine synthase II (cobalamin-independent) [Klebsiella pneumoniae]|nr:Methionine synthase II (cobalamin-independent) [Klebsiella pneumoniae]
MWAYLCSDAQRQQVRERGEDPDALARIYARVLNQALEGKPADLTVGLHVCRGNFRSTWISEGGYEPVAEVLFGSVNVDAFFLEYDNDRSGDFAPLRFIRPGHQQVVLGLITTKNGELENPQGVKRDSPRPRSTCRSSRSASARSAVSPPLKRECPQRRPAMAKGPSGDLHRRRRLVIAFLAQRCTVMRQRCHPLRHYRPPAPHPAVFTTWHLFCLITSG